MSFKVEVAYDAKATLGEGPHWDEANQRLFWVDILEKQLHIYQPHDNQMTTRVFDQYIGACVLTESGNLLLAMKNGIYHYSLLTEEKTKLADPEHTLPNNRFNDGKCDPAGRFWAGTMSLNEEKEQGSLYRLDSTGNIKKMLSPVTISNGLAWSPDQTYMYYIDTPTREVKVFRFDSTTGDITSTNQVIKIPPEMGYPDGMTIDEEGMLWIAHWGGSRITRWNPQTAKQLDEIPIPAKNVTSCTFGGKHLDELYITTARVGMNEIELEEYPLSGSLFKCKLPVKGIAPYLFHS